MVENDKKIEELIKENKSLEEEAKTKDKELDSLDKKIKLKRFKRFFEEHIELCKRVINIYDELHKAKDCLLLINISESDKKEYEKKIPGLKRDFQDAKKNLLERKRYYKEEKDFKKPFKSLSKIHKFLLINDN